MALKSIFVSLCILHFAAPWISSNATAILGKNQLTTLDIFLGSDDNIFPIQFESVQAEKSDGENGDLLTQFKTFLQSPLKFGGGISSVYANYLAAFGKDPNRASDGIHQSVFQSNLLYIAEHNAKADQGQSSYKMGINSFTDMTQAEFLNGYTGHDVNVTKALMESDIPLDQSFLEAGNLRAASSSKDWRQDGHVTNIKNQKNCGSCVTFSTIAVMESAVSIQKGQKNADFAEQEIVDCTRIGCGGGDWPDAFNYMKNGVSNEAQYPYKARKNSCTASSSNRAAGPKVSSWGYVSQRRGGENTMRDYVYNNGPIVLGVSVSRDFQYYKSGVFSGPCSGNINHAVATVGYGTDGKDFWIIKNSWDTTWGEKGYMRLQRGVNMCSVSEDAAYVRLN